MGSWIERRAARLARRRGRRDAPPTCCVGAGLAGARADGRHRLRRLGRHRARLGHRAPDRDRPRRLQRDRRRRCSPPRWPPAPRAPAAAASCSRWPAWARSASAATSAATSPTPRASASTSTTFEDYPQDWTQALADAALGEGEMRAVDVDGVAILIARRGGEVYALSDTCVHRGGSLADGELVGDCVQCPLHGSRFRLDGRLGRAGPGRLPAAGARGARPRRLDRGAGAAAPAERIRSRALHLNQRTGVTWQRSRRSACSAPG